jgi:hypothetical protein
MTHGKKERTSNDRKEDKQLLCDCCHEVILLMVVASWLLHLTIVSMKQKRLSEGDDAVLLDD